jgi:ABC-type lipoprotein export system ATPase subunit
MLGTPSERTAAVGLHFGIPLFGNKTVVVGRTRIPLGAGKVVVVLGPSGSGKSSILEAIEQQFASPCVVERVGFPPTTAVIDLIATGGSFDDAVEILTCCGLGEAHLWVRRCSELSEGERFRARLARAISLHNRAGTVAAPLLCDEFCSGLHRRAAKAIAFNLHKLVVRRHLCVVLACSQDDLMADLQPHVLVKLDGAGQCEVEERVPPRFRQVSFRRRLVIERGGKRDYEQFSAMHYRATDELGFVDKVFVLRDRCDASPLGVVVYSHSALELSLRNQVTNHRFSRAPSRLNRCFRVLRRLVIHPDLRGCGLGYYLVNRTLPMVGTEYVECLASMGEFNPVFEKAGMKRIGQYELSAKRQAAWDALGKLYVDPHGRDFPLKVARSQRVRRIVVQVVRDWYAATTGGGEARVERQSPRFLAQTFRSLIGSRPVYYLWQRPKRPRAA